MRFVLALVWLLSACGDTGTSPDAQVEDGQVPPSFEVLLPEPPTPPAPIRADSCPEGWTREVLEDGGAYCAAFAPGEPTACTGATHRLPGNDACVPIGPACDAAQRFAPFLPEDEPVVFVDHEVDAGGDGTRARPFRTIAQALLDVREGLVIALSKGVHRLDISVRRNVELRGACVAETVLVGDGDAVLLTGDGADVAVRDLRIEPSDQLGAYATRGTTLRLDHVLVQGGRDVAVAGLDATVVVRNSAIRGASAANRDAWAMLCSTRTMCLVEDTSISDVQGGGLAAEEGAHLTMTGSVVSRVDGMHAIGVLVSDSIASLNGVAIDDVGATSLVATNGATLSGRAIWMRRGDVFCLSSAPGSLIVLDEVVALSCQLGGVFQLGGDVRLTDLFVADTRFDLAGEGGTGMFLDEDALLHLERARFERVRVAGIAVNTGRLFGSDIAIDRVAATSARKEGFGITILDGSSAEIDRMEIRHATTYGVAVGSGYTNFGSEAVVRDLRVFDTHPEPASGDFGNAINVGTGSHVTLDRALLENNGYLGIDVRDRGTILDARDVVVRSTAPNEAGRFGLGLSAATASRVTVERALFESHHQVGVLATTSGQIIGTDVTIRDVLPAPCAESTCAGEALGVGAATYQNGLIDLAFFQIERASLCGIHMARGGELVVDTGRIADSLVAICVERPDFDLGRLRGVVYDHNGASLDTKTLPVPDLGLPN